ncbi:hypothetical protein ACFSNO_19750 [Streptomyces cirratus]
MDPVRLALTMGLVRAFGLDRAMEVRAARAAGDSTLRLVHREDYVAAVREVSADPGWPTVRTGSGPSTIRRSTGCTRRLR